MFFPTNSSKPDRGARRDYNGTATIQLETEKLTDVVASRFLEISLFNELFFENVVL